MRDTVREVARLFWAHDGFFLAAGLSFYVVICVVPLLLLLISGGGFLLSDAAVTKQVLDRVAEVLPVYRPEVEQILKGVIEARGVSSVLGTAILLAFASQLFAATRLVLNRIFGAPSRGFLRGMVFDLAMIVLLTLLFFVTVGVTAAYVWMTRMSALLPGGSHLGALLQLAGVLLAVPFNTLLFVALYRFVPGTRIAWGSVLRGSVTAAVLWELAKQLFRLYIEGVDVYSSLYGSVGVTIALTMWIYYSALVFVLGAELIRALEQRRADVAAV